MGLNGSGAGSSSLSCTLAEGLLVRAVAGREASWTGNASLLGSPVSSALNTGAGRVLGLIPKRAKQIAHMSLVPFL
jgi:hypothetical protein